MTLLEETMKAATEALTTTLENWKQREIQWWYLVLDIPATRTPKVDNIFSSSESRFSRNTEFSLSIGQGPASTVELYAGCHMITQEISQTMTATYLMTNMSDSS